MYVPGLGAAVTAAPMTVKGTNATTSGCPFRGVTVAGGKVRAKYLVSRGGQQAAGRPVTVVHEAVDAGVHTRHEGVELIEVVEGTVEVLIAFDRIQLEAGDHLSFNAAQPHQVRATSSGAAVAIHTLLLPEA